jgi:hypothetical protein
LPGEGKSDGYDAGKNSGDVLRSFYILLLIILINAGKKSCCEGNSYFL